MTLALALVACEQPHPGELSDGPTSERALPSSAPRLEPHPEMGASCWTTQTDDRGTVTTRYRVDAEGHPVRAVRPGSWSRDFERSYAPDGDLSTIEVRTTWFTPARSQTETWRYVGGRLVAGHPGQYEWDGQGRLTFASVGDDVWTFSRDESGRIYAMVHGYWGAFQASRTVWGWDGDRLVGSKTRDTVDGDFQGGAEWEEWEGDLPVRGTVSDSRGSWEERWEWEDGRPLLHTSTRSGSEEVVGAWVWDGDRLLEVEYPNWREVWTWDEAGHPLSMQIEATDRDGEVSGALQAFVWDGDSLVEATHASSSGTTTWTWSGRCPERAWAGSVWPVDERWERYETPFPSDAPYLPFVDEPW